MIKDNDNDDKIIIINCIHDQVGYIELLGKTYCRVGGGGCKLFIQILIPIA